MCWLQWKKTSEDFFAVEKYRESERGKNSPSVKIESMCKGRRPSQRQTETSLREMGRGEGGWARKGWRHVKVSQDHMAGKSWPHKPAARNLGNFVFGNWRSPWEVLSKPCDRERPETHTPDRHTHTHTESWSDPNLNSLDERWHCLNNPHFLQMCAHQMRRGCTLKPELHPCPYAFLTFESSEGVNICLGRICPPDTTEE